MWWINYIWHQQDEVPIRIQSKHLTCNAFCLISLAFCFIKKSCLRRIFFTKSLLFHLFVIEFQGSFSVYIFIGSENNLNCNTEWLQQRNLCKTAMKPLSKNKPLVKSEHVRYKVTVASKLFWKIRESHTSVWGVNSTSDCFVWKVTSERVAQRCDKTSCQGANEFLFTKTPLF